MKKHKKKVVSIEDKIPTLKEERKKKANRRLLFYLSIFFILISIIIYLQSPLSYIKTVDIKGNLVLAEDDITQLAEITNKTNIWTVSRKELKSKLESVDIIKEAAVEKKLPQTIEISIEEHFIVGYVNKEDEFYPVLDNGNILIENNFFNLGDAPLLNDFTDEQYLNRMVEELRKLPTSILQLISEINWNPSEKNKYKVTLYMIDGFIVEATIRDFSNKMKNYPSIVSQLDEDVEGIIHMNVGSYFEEID